jgi:hypothetical protein
MICSLTFAQSFIADLEKLKQLEFLKSTKEDAIKLLNNEDVGYNDSPDFDISYFYSEDANITVSYSSGNCSDENEDWNVPEGRITEITIAPKTYININNIEIDYSKFRKERPRRDYKKLYVYHNKKAGIAIWAYSDRVEFVIFFPSEKDFPQLCDKPEVKKYYSSKKWLRDPSIYNTTYHNYPPPDVVGLNLSKTEIVKSIDSDMKIEVSAEIINPMNEVITYEYRISGGKIVGSGKDVVWDLSGVKSGTYKITAIADNGCGICGKWITKMVVVKECPDCSRK